jgi:hypothetical protein
VSAGVGSPPLLRASTRSDSGAADEGVDAAAVPEVVESRVAGQPVVAVLAVDVVRPVFAV